MRKSGTNWFAIYAGLFFTVGLGNAWEARIERCFDPARLPYSTFDALFHVFTLPIAFLVTLLLLAKLIQTVRQRAAQQTEGVPLYKEEPTVRQRPCIKPLRLRDFLTGIYGLSCAVVGTVSFVAHFFTGRLSVGLVALYTAVLPLSFVVGVYIIVRVTKPSCIAGLASDNATRRQGGSCNAQ